MANGAVSLEKMREKLLNQKTFLSENEFLQLVRMVADILIEQSNVVVVNAPVTICGDIHGQFYDLLELFKQGGHCPDTSYIFMGDFVDRGHHSVETISLLLLYKAMYSSRMTLIRGNHESRAVSKSYGFYDECLKKYGSANCWRHCTDMFDLIPISAMINNKVLCVHGGLSPDVSHIDHISLIERDREVPTIGPFCDLLWSDPSDFETGESWVVSPRGAGWVFGGQVVKEFNHLNGIDLIARAHQLVNSGYQYHFGGSLVTVWSAPNYCYRCGNVASILSFDDKLERRVTIFEDCDDTRENNMLPKPVYFL